MLIPATAATVERAHSSLKFVKNDLRSTMSEDRMNALMLLYIHKGLSLNSKIIDDFARTKSQKNVISKSSRMKNFDLFSQCVIFTKNLCKGCGYNFFTHIFQLFWLDFKLLFIILFLGIISWKGTSRFNGSGVVFQIGGGGGSNSQGGGSQGGHRF